MYVYTHTYIHPYVYIDLRHTFFVQTFLVLLWIDGGRGAWISHGRNTVYDEIATARNVNGGTWCKEKNVCVCVRVCVCMYVCMYLFVCVCVVMLYVFKLHTTSIVNHHPDHKCTFPFDLSHAEVHKRATGGNPRQHLAHTRAWRRNHKNC